ncbi:hypothetical protein BCR42DRAFT_427343 [Absidia repens]|uniref:CCDC174 alpha/beta GRSR domain-containing protein n=1 Tax=Absidia repens TaxID=90262 RepID=A0A1X2HZT6_9FUNG|nr:hypothetical protein BCR42DRAFT_427343 [Absidia repens]
MPPKKIIETNASSLIDLKALVAQQEAEFNRKRTTDPSSSQRPITNKKPKQHLRTNRGVQDRAQRDTQTATNTLDDSDMDAVEKSRRALEQKALLYESLQRRGHLDDNDDNDALLIDFDQKYQTQASRQRRTHDEKNNRHKDDDDDDDKDPWVEYEDEFGRTRVVRASAVPSRSRSPSPSSRRSSFSDNDDMQIDQADRANIRHYQASQEETRVRGVGHYQFDTDDDALRQRQMASLLQLRQETQQARRQSRTASQRRKALVAKRAERVHHYWATLRNNDNNNSNNTKGEINEDSVTQLLQTLRQQSGY